MKTNCFLCGHQIYPGDEGDGVPVCRVCLLSMKPDELDKALTRRMMQHKAQHEPKAIGETASDS